jgi:hypothetical protein
MPDTQVHNGPVTTPLSMSPQPPRRSRKHWVWIALAGGAFLAALAALAVVLVVNTGKSTPAVNPATVYQQKLSSTLTPVVAANQTLSASLQSLDGSKASIHNSKTATTNAQQALTAANGAVAIITVPSSSTQLSQQAKQALTQENGYLQSVSTTLGDPTGNTTASVQPLASATSSAFVPLASVAPRGSASIYGVDNILAWSQGATAAANRNAPRAVVNNNTTVVNPPVVVTPPSSSGGAPNSGSMRFCDQNIQADSISTSCQLAENTFVAYWNSGSLDSGWGDATVTAFSPVTNQSYSMSCTTDQVTVNCFGTAGSSTLRVGFPMRAVQVY